MQNRLSRLSQFLTFSGLVLVFLLSTITLQAQQGTPTTTAQPTNWIRIEEPLWTELQDLSKVLETRLMQRVEQVKSLQTLLEQSEQTILNLEEQSQRLNSQLRETSKSLEESENLLAIERQANDRYVDTLLSQRDTARNQRDTELASRLKTESQRDTARIVAGVSGGLNILLLLLMVFL